MRTVSLPSLVLTAQVVFTARCTTVQSTLLRSHVVWRLSVCLSVCLSLTLVDQDHIGWKSRKLIARTISPTSSLFVAHRSSTYSQWDTEKFRGENVRSTPTSVTSGWIESAENHAILGGSVAVCLLLSAHLCDSTAFLSIRARTEINTQSHMRHWSVITLPGSHAGVSKLVISPYVKQDASYNKRTESGAVFLIVSMFHTRRVAVTHFIVWHAEILSFTFQ